MDPLTEVTSDGDERVTQTIVFAGNVLFHPARALSTFDVAEVIVSPPLLISVADDGPVHDDRATVLTVIVAVPLGVANMSNSLIVAGAEERLQETIGPISALPPP